MKKFKPRNYIALALLQRNGSGAHDKSHKAKRNAEKRELIKELKKPSVKIDGFLLI